MTEFSQHGEWLSLIDVSGPFLAEPVLKQAFPQGLEKTAPLTRKNVRQAYDEWREAHDTEDAQSAEIHDAWIDLVLKKVLELDEDNEGDVLKPESELPESLTVLFPEHDVTLRPDFAVVDEEKDDQPLMFITVHAPDMELSGPVKGDKWAASPEERMVELCRARDVRLGLVTNGERWMFVDAPVGGVTSFASWYARLWTQEPITLQAFINLLGIRRFFVDDSERLPALLDQSLKLQDEVTDALGEQVRRAVEILVQALDRADLDRNRELLSGVQPPQLYEAALTVLMRIVFLLSAEERGLLLLDDERYQEHYAVSTLRMQLRAESEEILERRQDAWSRLLAIFRAVFGGIDHEVLKLPALGGSLFDPDRFPFLEGRPISTSWKDHPAAPLPIDNRTVLLLLDAVQLFEGRTLSYRALDIEQIGYVYEGLLERTVVRAPEVTLDLDATKNTKTPWVTLSELETAAARNEDAVRALLKDRTGSSAGRVKNDLAKQVDEAIADRLLTACHGKDDLRNRIKPYLHFLRMDRWGYPLVYPEGTFMVTTGVDRRETGTHYTPKNLTEAIVKETLEPIIYVGPEEGISRADWILRPPDELLELKICDPAMGSGAFLVQVCRWLADRLVEAWDEAETAGKVITSDGKIVDNIGGLEPLHSDDEDRILTARRLIAERCLYGVDMNPLAVELAKLSIWLITLAKGRPFGFLEHNLRCGDSLLGVYKLEQLLDLDMAAGKNRERKLFGEIMKVVVEETLGLRTELRNRPILDIRDVEYMALLDRRAQHKIKTPQLIADAIVGNVLAGRNTSDTVALSIMVEDVISNDLDQNVADILQGYLRGLQTDHPDDKPRRRTLHWPLEFPEVFYRDNSGFDAIVGNPPFLGGRRITTVMGRAYNRYLAALHTGAGRNVDLVAHFFRRAFSLLRNNGQFGLLATNTIAEGDTRQGGLERMLNNGATIHAAYPDEPWSGKATVVTSRVHIRKGEWHGPRMLSGTSVCHISAFLSQREVWDVKKLKENRAKAFQGSIVLGMGFVLTNDQASLMLDADDRNADVIFPYLNGKDLNADPDQRSDRYVINFWDWSEEKAMEYSLPYQWIKKHVYPERLEKSRQHSYRHIMSMWWLHWNVRPALYHAIGFGEYFERHPAGWSAPIESVKRVLVVTRESKTLAFLFVPAGHIFSEKTVVFSLSGSDDFSIIQSSMHAAFAWQWASRLGVSLRYSPTDALQPFPFPVEVDGKTRTILSDTGARFYDARRDVMREHGIGLTNLYGRFHDKNDNATDIANLRELYRELDQGVMLSYGWTDLDLEHDFHKVGYLPDSHGPRFTISETARIEVLNRMSQTNRERYMQEQ